MLQTRAREQIGCLKQYAAVETVSSISDSERFPTNLGIPPLEIKNLLESDPLKSRLLLYIYDITYLKSRLLLTPYTLHILLTSYFTYNMILLDPLKSRLLLYIM